MFAHTPEGAGFRVAVRPRDGGGAAVVVADTGQGMSLTSVERGRSGRGSTRPGPDLARRTAESSGSGLRLASSAAGATVTLDLDPPA